MAYQIINYLSILDSADFDISPQFITFPGDKDTLPVQVLLTDDGILEEKESFIVTLNVTGNVKEVIVGKQDSVMVTIEDNDGKYVNLFVCVVHVFNLCICISTHVCVYYSKACCTDSSRIFAVE